MPSEYWRHFYSITMDKNLLLFGYGNPDRGDDGAAYHIFRSLFAAKKIDEEQIFSADVIHLNDRVDVIFNFQLLPEYADLVAEYDQVVFIDAHTAEIEEELKLQPLEADFQHSPFTHHFSPSSCLAVAESLAGKAPEAWLLSIRGYEFGFDRHLSERTNQLVMQAIALLHRDFLE
jgi:hydrogenase maturation protease